ncbi:MAG: outer membrane protein [Crocinitomicaceae bacterium]|jgi:outer membrane protein
MKKLLALSLFVFISLAGFSQEVKIGYTNIELVMAYMPERKEANLKLKAFTEEYMNEAEIMQKQLEVKKTNYSELVAKSLGTPEHRSELDKLTQQIKMHVSGHTQAEAKMRKTLFEPLEKKVLDAIEAVRVEKEYSVILNYPNGLESNTILAISKSCNITNAVLDKLGVEL